VGSLDEWRHCPRCGAPVAPESGRVTCASCGLTAYAHSDVTACALVVDERGRLLLARRAGEPEQGKWDLPGGFLAEGEHPLDGIRRELLEETGLSVEPVEFLGVWMDRYGSEETAPATLNLYWTARILSGEPSPADDVAELRWFAPEELPEPGELAFHLPAVLAAWRLRSTS
jgi:ADP-ribose pyrophosphatase YjhB (NUDIX family)